MRLIEKHNTLIWVGNIKVGSGLHLKLVHSGTSLGDIQLVGILAGHSRLLLSVSIGARLLRPVGYRRHSMSAKRRNMPPRRVVNFAQKDTAAGMPLQITRHAAPQNTALFREISHPVGKSYASKVEAEKWLLSSGANTDKIGIKKLLPPL